MGKLWKNRILFERLRLLTLVLMVIFLMVRRIAALEFIGTMRIWPALLAAMGAALLAWDFFAFHTLFSGRRLIPLFLFLIVCLISAVLNRRYGIKSALALIIYQTVQILLIYSMMHSFSSKQVQKEMNLLISLFLALLIICEIIAVISLLFNVEFIYYKGNDVMKYYEQGYQSPNGRVWGVYYDANYLGINAVLSLVIGAWRLVRSKKWFGRVLYALVIALGFFCMVISGSRTALVSFIAIMFFVAMLALPRFRERFSRLASSLLSVVLAAALMGGAFGGVMLVQGQAARLQSLVVESVSPRLLYDINLAFYKVYSLNKDFRIHMRYLESLRQYEEKNHDKPDSHDKSYVNDMVFVDKLGRFDVESREDITNKRKIIWMEALKVFRARPIFGASLRNTVNFARDNHLSKVPFFLGLRTVHNGYLEVLTGTGIAGFAALGWFALMSSVDYVAYFTRRRKYFADVAMTGLCLAGLMVALLFVSDVFNDFSINSFLFWLLLGAGTRLIRLGTEESKPDRGTLLFADTPLQTMNASTFALQEKKRDPEARFDLYVYKQFRGSEELIEWLRASGVFGEVVGFQPLPWKKGALSKLRTLRNWMRAEKIITRLADRSLPEGHYERMGICFFTPFTDLLRLAHPNEEIVLLEDGIGTYTIPDLEHEYRSGIHRLVTAWFMAPRLDYAPKRCYVHRPDWMPEGTAFEALPLEAPNADPKHFEALCGIFSFRKNDLYRTHRIVYLTQPLEEKCENAEAREREIIEALPSKPLFRVHPRQETAAYEKMGETDTVGNLWELEIAEGIDDRSVLIGALSTAQAMPYMLYGKKPKIIFTYRLLGDNWPAADAILNALRRGMGEDKVLVPDSIAELREAVQ